MLKRIARVGDTGRARIITAAKSDNNATIAAARFTYNRLLKRGVEIYEYQPTKLHSKLMVLDDVVHIGSSNFDIRSLYLNLEMMLRVDDADFAGLMRVYFEGELDDSQPITREVYKQRASLLNRIKWALVVLPRHQRRLHRDPPAQLRRRVTIRLGRLAGSRYAQNRVAGGTLIHSKPRSIRSKCGAMKSRTLGLN